MDLFSFVASVLSVLFGLYCLAWSLVLGTTSSATLRIGAAFIGVLLFLLAYTYYRISPKTR